MASQRPGSTLCVCLKSMGSWVTTLILAFKTQINQNDCVVHMLCGNRVPLSKTVSIIVWLQQEGVFSCSLSPEFVIIQLVHHCGQRMVSMAICMLSHNATSCGGGGSREKESFLCWVHRVMHSQLKPLDLVVFSLGASLKQTLDFWL